MKTVLVHIGYHKTGTTSLQYRLRQVAPETPGAEFVYPRTLSSWFGHAEIAWALSSERYRWADRDYSLDEVHRYYKAICEAPGPQKIILSSEEFCRLDADATSKERVGSFFHDTFRDAEVVIVAYVRNARTFLQSRYRHEVQGRNQKASFPDFVSQQGALNSADFDMRLSYWDSVFPGKVVVRSYDEVIANKGDILADFCEAVGVSMPQGLAEHNEVKLHYGLLEAARNIASAKLPKDLENKYFGFLFNISRDLDQHGYRAVSPFDLHTLPPHVTNALADIQERLHKRLQKARRAV